MPFKNFFAVCSSRPIAVAVSLILLAGCTANKEESGRSYTMGQASKVGPLTYTVVETEWQESLDGALGQRIPKHRFLLLNVNIVNKSAAEVNVPFLTLIDVNGAEFREENKGEGVTAWLGYLRRVGPGETTGGKIVFDVPPGGYKLRISSGGEAEAETTAMVEIPYHAVAPPVKGVDPMAVPQAN